jgi:hypothetical protein
VRSAAPDAAERDALSAEALREILDEDADLVTALAEPIAAMRGAGPGMAAGPAGGGFVPVEPGEGLEEESWDGFIAPRRATPKA